MGTILTTMKNNILREVISLKDSTLEDRKILLRFLQRSNMPVATSPVFTEENSPHPVLHFMADEWTSNDSRKPTTSIGDFIGKYSKTRKQNVYCIVVDKVNKPKPRPKDKDRFIDHIQLSDLISDKLRNSNPIVLEYLANNLAQCDYIILRVDSSHDKVLCLQEIKPLFMKFLEMGVLVLIESVISKSGTPVQVYSHLTKYTYK